MIPVWRGPRPVPRSRRLGRKAASGGATAVNRRVAGREPAHLQLHPGDDFQQLDHMHLDLVAAVLSPRSGGRSARSTRDDMRLLSPDPIIGWNSSNSILSQCSSLSSRTSSKSHHYTHAADLFGIGPSILVIAGEAGQIIAPGVVRGEQFKAGWNHIVIQQVRVQTAHRCWSRADSHGGLD